MTTENEETPTGEHIRPGLYRNLFFLHIPDQKHDQFKLEKHRGFGCRFVRKLVFALSSGVYERIGVIGLTTALKMQEEGGYSVTILAEQFPTDPKTVKYASLSAVSLTENMLVSEVSIRYVCQISGSSPCQRCRR